MIINYYGNSCFKLRSSKGELVTDPQNLPKLEPDVVVISNKAIKKDLSSFFKNKPFVIDQPGEYEIKEISLFVYPGNISVIQMDGLNICHLPAFDNDLTDEQLEQLNGIDVLLIGLGSKDTAKLVNKIEPLIVIPMQYEDQGLQAFVKELGQEGEKIDKLNITRAGLPPELKLFILQNN